MYRKRVESGEGWYRKRKEGRNGIGKGWKEGDPEENNLESGASIGEGSEQNNSKTDQGGVRWFREKRMEVKAWRL